MHCYIEIRSAKEILFSRTQCAQMMQKTATLADERCVLSTREAQKKLVVQFKVKATIVRLKKSGRTTPSLTGRYANHTFERLSTVDLTGTLHDREARHSCGI